MDPNRSNVTYQDLGAAQGSPGSCSRVADPPLPCRELTIFIRFVRFKGCLLSYLAQDKLHVLLRFVRDKA